MPGEQGILSDPFRWPTAGPSLCRSVGSGAWFTRAPRGRAVDLGSGGLKPSAQ